MNTVISQPMLFPWIGMLEQVRLAQCYVHYSDVQFSKGSFVNRVQIKCAGGIKWLTVPIHAKLSVRIDEAAIDDTQNWRKAHIDKLSDAYANAPFFKEMISVVHGVYDRDYDNIGRLSEASLMAICNYYGLDQARSFLRSSDLAIIGSSSHRVLNIVLKLGSDCYITGPGAKNYLNHELFEQAGVRVEYMDYQTTPYRQQHGNFTPYVSSLDLIANCGLEGRRYICSGSIHWKEFINATS